MQNERWGSELFDKLELSNYYLQIIFTLKYVQCKKPIALQYT